MPILHCSHFKRKPQDIELSGLIGAPLWFLYRIRYLYIIPAFIALTLALGQISFNTAYSNHTCTKAVSTMPEPLVTFARCSEGILCDPLALELFRHDGKVRAEFIKEACSPKRPVRIFDL